MARIRTPKPLLALTKDHANISLFTLLDKVGPTDHKGRYLPWDKFIRKPLPASLSQEQGWLATKMARKVLNKKLLLDASKNQSFSYCTPELLVAQLNYIDKLCGGGKYTGVWSGVYTIQMVENEKLA